MRKCFLAPALLIISGVLLFCVAPCFAQSSMESGILKIHVSPKQAYVFVDGKAIRDGSQSISLASGDHQVGVYNYGFSPKIQKVHISAGESTDLSVSLQASGGAVAGPFAELEFKGDPRAAVLLTGDKPAYFVGHVDEFDWDWIWHQRLLVRSGTYNVTVTHKGNTIWSGKINAEAGKHITVYLNQNGRTKTQDWKEGLNMAPQPRFRAGIASATIPVAPVTSQLAAQSTSISCGQNTTLNWKSANAVDDSISNIGDVSQQGDRTVSPSASSTYVLTAVGPGGNSTHSVKVNVNIQPVASISLSQPEVRYHKIGDKVVEDDSSTLTWATSNANSVQVSPFGNEAESGTRTVTAKPQTQTEGPLNEDQTYTLTTANGCGGTLTKTATLHVVGSIDPPPPITLASLFYPTAYPTRHHPNIGLVANEKRQLATIAKNFIDYQPYDHKGTLLIVAHADIRGPRRYNQDLSERRAAVIKNFLVARGVSADKIEVRALGKTQQLTESKVKVLLSNDPQKPEKWESHHMRTTWLAYNRRVDIVLQPRDIKSTKNYPNDVAYARLLWQRPEPSLKKVEMAGRITPSSSPMSASTSGAGGSN